MPGGMASAWDEVKSMLESISAKADDGSPCVAWMGTGGAGIPNQELADIFDDWNNGELQSYLIEITSKILRRVDDKTGESLVDLILDEAAQKGRADGRARIHWTLVRWSRRSMQLWK